MEETEELSVWLIIAVAATFALLTGMLLAGYAWFVRLSVRDEYRAGREAEALRSPGTGSVHGRPGAARSIH